MLRRTHHWIPHIVGAPKSELRNSSISEEYLIFEERVHRFQPFRFEIEINASPIVQCLVSY